VVEEEVLMPVVEEEGFWPAVAEGFEDLRREIDRLSDFGRAPPPQLGDSQVLLRNPRRTRHRLRVAEEGFLAMVAEGLRICEGKSIVFPIWEGHLLLSSGTRRSSSAILGAQGIASGLQRRFLVGTA
jgi:hypothetical protein